MEFIPALEAHSSGGIVRYFLGLAGALARPVWALLPFFADWRWGREEDETPNSKDLERIEQTNGVYVYDHMCSKQQDNLNPVMVTPHIKQTHITEKLKQSASLSSNDADCFSFSVSSSLESGLKATR